MVVGLVESILQWRITLEWVQLEICERSVAHLFGLDITNACLRKKSNQHRQTLRSFTLSMGKTIITTWKIETWMVSQHISNITTTYSPRLSGSEHWRPCPRTRTHSDIETLGSWILVSCLFYTQKKIKHYVCYSRSLFQCISIFFVGCSMLLQFEFPGIFIELRYISVAPLKDFMEILKYGYGRHMSRCALSGRGSETAQQLSRTVNARCATICLCSRWCCHVHMCLEPRFRWCLPPTSRSRGKPIKHINPFPVVVELNMAKLYKTTIVESYIHWSAQLDNSGISYQAKLPCHTMAIKCINVFWYRDQHCSSWDSNFRNNLAIVLLLKVERHASLRFLNSTMHVFYD